MPMMWGAQLWPVFMLLVIAASTVVVFGVALGHLRAHGNRPARAGQLPRADDILAERFANGEIGNDEYLERLAQLRLGERLHRRSRASD